MDARSSLRAVLLASAVAASFAALPALAGGGHGGPVFHPSAGWHGGASGLRSAGGSHWGIGARGLPPLAGVIHERAGARPYFSSYGHTNTAWQRAGDSRLSEGGYRHFATVIPAGAYGGRSVEGYGHTGSEVRPSPRGGAGLDRGYAFRDRFRFAGERRRFADGRFAVIYGGGYPGYGGYGGYGDVGSESDADAGQGNPGGPSGYGGGPYQRSAIGPTFTYASEMPLAARLAEPPLAPSPYAGHGGANDYADAASEDLTHGPGPRIVTTGRASSPGCTCSPFVQTMPVVYRYGVGTAY